jgi:adenylate cyclase
LERRLAAILAADVVGYSRLMGADEVGTLERLKFLRRELVQPKIAERKGRIVKVMGDGLLAEFPSVVEAVYCAVEIQEALYGREANVAEDDRIRLRIGINLGDIIVEGTDIYGDGVNVAARLEGLAEPGGVYVSGSVYNQVCDRIEIPFVDLGEREVKNIDRPVRVWRWVRDTAGALPEAVRTNEPEPLPEKPSIVVLPFDNMSRDPEQEYFSDGISDDIITDLSKVSGLFVIARNSAFVYKDKAVNVPDVCRELGVKFALEGSIRKAGNRVRVTAQLIDGSSGGHLWAERYDRDLIDIFEVQDDVTQAIVAALKVTLSAAERALIVDGGTKNVGSHDFFMKGRGLLFGRKRDREMFDQSTAYFRRAIELDPKYAGPYAGLGMAYMLDHQNRWCDAP